MNENDDTCLVCGESPCACTIGSAFVWLDKVAKQAWTSPDQVRAVLPRSES